MKLVSFVPKRFGAKNGHSPEVSEPGYDCRKGQQKYSHAVLAGRLSLIRCDELLGRPGPRAEAQAGIMHANAMAYRRQAISIEREASTGPVDHTKCLKLMACVAATGGELLAPVVSKPDSAALSRTYSS